MGDVRVLVVAGDASARDIVVASMQADSYEVRAVADGTSALEQVHSFRAHLALLDGGITDGEGGSAAARFRDTADIPIVFLARPDSSERIHADFRVGVDDYVVEPFDPGELSWRVRSALRRNGHTLAQVWEFADLVLDESSARVSRAGSVVSLTAIEFNLLRALVRNAERVVTRRELVSAIWGEPTADHGIEVHVSSLRHKLELHGPRIIQTIRGMGYVLRN